MKLGLLLPTMQSIALNTAALQAAEMLGADDVWVLDHLLGFTHPALWPEFPAARALPDPDALLDPFCVAAEEVSHFVYLSFCAQAVRQVTQLELELQGEVDKYLSAVFLISLQNEGAVSPMLRELMFRRYRLADHVVDEEGRERYHRASDLAYRYCGYLEARFLRASRLHDLAREARRFYRLGQRDKLERIASLQ